MEPAWAAVNLLISLEEWLEPNKGAECRMPNAIRVLPAPLAGDLLVTSAARGEIGVIVSYYQRGAGNSAHHMDSQRNVWEMDKIEPTRTGFFVRAQSGEELDSDLGHRDHDRVRYLLYERHSACGKDKSFLSKHLADSLLPTGLPLDHVHAHLKYQALHAAAEFGYLDSARLLVAMGAQVQACAHTRAYLRQTMF